MARWMRLFASLLLAIALPSQGVVAATMSLCGPNHAATMVPAGHEADHALHAHPGQAGHAGDHHAGHDGPAKPVDGHKCTACGVCAAAHGIAPSGIHLPPAYVAPLHFAAETPGVEPFVSDAPERPPRLPLA